MTTLVAEWDFAIRRASRSNCHGSMRAGGAVTRRRSRRAAGSFSARVEAAERSDWRETGAARGRTALGCGRTDRMDGVSSGEICRGIFGASVGVCVRGAGTVMARWRRARARADGAAPGRGGQRAGESATGSSALSMRDVVGGENGVALGDASMVGDGDGIDTSGGVGGDSDGGGRWARV